MSDPIVIVKVTGHGETAEQAGKLDYLNELRSHGNWQHDLMTATERRQLLGKNRRMYAARPGERITRIPAQIIQVTGAGGIVREKKTGTITDEYLAHLDDLEAQGFQIYQRIVTGVKVLRDDHGYVRAHPRGTITPATWRTRLEAQEKGWTASVPAAAGMPILADVIRENIRRHPLKRLAVKTRTGTKKVSRTIASHNLVVAPAPHILEQIRRAGQPVDQVLEMIGRRALERFERARGAQITAVASTHLQDEDGIRPHLHIRMASNDSNGEYIALYEDNGSRRCLLQREIERDMIRTIERWDQPRGRD